MGLRIKSAALFFLFCLLNAALAYAGVIDPLPLFRISDSPQRTSDISDRTRLFLYPQSEKFRNDPEKVVVETLMMEALGEGFDGMVAVGEVIRHRMQLFDKDPAEVCLMPKQFSCWNDPTRAREFLEKYQDHYFIALMAWRESEKTELTAGATDYHADYVHPYWADAYQVAARLGAHIFYVRERG